VSNNRFADLETFVAVVDAGSFTGAASRMGRSKAGVSRQVKSLEERLGARLLNRTTRSLSLTDSGQALYERTATALGQLRDAETAASQAQVAPQGRLKISLPVVFGSRVATAPLLDLARAHAGLELDLTFSDRFVDLVGEGFDLALRVGSLADSSLVARRLCSTRRVVCAAPSYLDRRDAPSDPADLSGHDCLLYSQQVDGSSWRFSGGRTVAVRGRVRADSGEALLRAAVAGMGVAWLPDFYVDEDLETGRLVPLLGEHEADPLGIWAVYPARQYMSLKLRLALDCLSEALS
jgi:DNA-binding transcriptional LysR family regulator